MDHRCEGHHACHTGLRRPFAASEIAPQASGVAAQPRREELEPVGAAGRTAEIGRDRMPVSRPRRMWPHWMIGIAMRRPLKEQQYALAFFCTRSDATMTTKNATIGGISLGESGRNLLISW